MQGVSQVQEHEVSLLEKEGDAAAWLSIFNSGFKIGMGSQDFSGDFLGFFFD